MKKIVLLLSMLISAGAMATNNLTCAVFENATPIAETKLSIDLEKSGSYVDTWVVENHLLFSVKKSERGYINITLSNASGFERTVVSSSLVGKMSENEFISVRSVDSKINSVVAYSAICYLTGSSTQGPWEL